jgi:hypothetical protein
MDKCSNRYSLPVVVIYVSLCENSVELRNRECRIISRINADYVPKLCGLHQNGITYIAVRIAPRV